MTSQAARLPLPILPESQVDGKRLIDARLPVDNWQGVELCYNAAVVACQAVAGRSRTLCTPILT